MWSVCRIPPASDLRFISGTPGPREAHGAPGRATARLYSRGGAPWTPVPIGDLPDPLPSMPSALLIPRQRPEWLLVGRRHGEIRLGVERGTRRACWR